MSSGYQVPDDYAKLQSMIETLRSDVNTLQNKVLRIPTLQADPALSDATNIWFMDDGRLRGRLRDDTIVEFSATTHIHDTRYMLIPAPVVPVKGTPVATVLPPPPKYVPKTRVYASGTDWVQGYNAHGQRTDKPDLYYGYYDSWNGENKSMVHFPGIAAALAPTSAGCRISEVSLRLINLHTNLNSGAELRLGLHNAAGKPGSFSENQWSPMKVHVNKSGYGAIDQTYKLPTWVGDRMRDGSATGFTFDQHTTDRSYYGFARSTGITLRIVYVK